MSEGPEDEYLSISEAVTAYVVSEASLRRRVLRGEVSGALKRKGRRGMEWRLPDGALAALGYRPRSAGESGGREGEKDAAIRNLTEKLHWERTRWEEWDRRLGGALTDVARLKAELRNEREDNIRLRAELERSRTQGRVIDLDAKPQERSPHPREPR